MKKLLLTIICVAMSFANALSQGFPEISTDNKTKWYLIQFMNGGNAFTAESDNADITTSGALGSDAQLWKVTGDATNGYTFTNKKGYTLCAASATLNNMVKASSSPSGVTKFFIDDTKFNAYAGGFELKPKGNTNISMNIFGGPEENRGVGFWNADNDQNNVVQFVELTLFENLSSITLIPYPANIEIADGKLNISDLKTITYPNDDVKKYTTDFAAALEQTAGIKLEVKESGANSADGEIWLAVDATLPKEGYTLKTSEKRIEIKAATKAGFFYAIQTLKQLLPIDIYGNVLNKDAEWSMPIVDIADQPQFEHRGFMMDVARHFFDKDEVKKVLDVMAIYKMNRLHWHLTDDQGWRIEIPEYPLLTEIGAVRSGSFTSPGDGTKFFDDTEYGRGMYFTQNDLREIVAYAAERNIDIMPEIDLPGHMVAAVTSYPELSCDPTKEYSVRLDGGISQDVLNIGKDETIDFLKCVLDNVANIFPFPYIHIGGDECPTNQWQTNEDCLRRVQEEGLAGVHELQSWLVEELGTYLKEKHGKDIVVWDELLAHWTSNNAVKPVIMAWNSLGKTADAANKGFKSIATPYSHVYIDFMQVGPDKTVIDEPYYGGWSETNTNTLEEAYSLNPAGSLSGREEYCMGVQCNLWAETLNDNIELEYQLLPRMIAVAETGWLPSSKKNWGGFYKRLQSHDEVLDLLGYTYAKHYIEQKELTAAEQAVKEATEILDASIRGGVGYPAADAYDALKNALDAVKGDDVTALNNAISAYKEAAITQPEAGKTYQIVSASTYYKRQYAGSTMYQSDNSVRFHYTPQTEPEELWQFTVTDGGYVMKNLFSGKQITMDTYNAAVKMTDSGTAVRIDKATVATKDVTYVPGAVTISAVSGYSASTSGNIKRLSAECSGDIYAKNEAALCYNGTWKFVEVTDFKAQLQGLVKKCELIVLTAKPEKMGEPSETALEYLKNNVITPANETLKDATVSEQQYNAYVALYNQFQMMPRASLADTIDDSFYYYIRNGYYTSYYAAYNSSNSQVEPKSKGTTDNYLWKFVKNIDGTVAVINKANGKPAYVSGNGVEQKIMVGSDYSWTLRETQADTGNKGIAIVGKDGSSAWYTNPDAWKYLLTKPYDWGGSVWTLEKSTVEVETAIDDVKTENGEVKTVYDLQGRKVENPIKGIYIVNGKKVMIK
ncbi:MAG: beta-N-acetylhexosaminidase [Bacteroidaceae bacterium]|nr:beta-N-acetylhexosaminidase [Bacteroidaceae bacterium]